MKVWFILDKGSPSEVEVQDVADVDDLKEAVKGKCPNSLSGVDSNFLHVFSGGSMLRPDTLVPDGTTYDTALIVRIDSEVGVAPEPKKLKSKQTFDMSTLLSPLEVLPPTKPSKPEFTCSEGWMETVETDIEAQLERSDDPSGSERIPPMAVVRCSRGGKTRALYEIANKMYERRPSRDPVAVIYVSFNDFSSLDPEEQRDPLQALCRRIAFTARMDPPRDMDKANAFEQFRSKSYDIKPEQILEWLGNSRAILLIDELNNLTALAEYHSVQATRFGNFLKKNFIRPEGRYCVFSSHILSTVSAFGEFVDPSNGSFRDVTLQELPLVDNLSTAIDHLYAFLDGAREAIYYGLMPGIIYLKGLGRPVEGKRMIAVSRYNEQSGNKEKEFKGILRSLIFGKLQDVPAQLHILLDGCGEIGSQKIRWVPFHLQYVLENMELGDEQRVLAMAMAQLCKGLTEADEASGKGWEALFVLFLIARCIIREPDGYFVPDVWFADSPFVEVKYNPYHHTKRPIGLCKDWGEFQEGVTASSTPTVSIFYPSHTQFKVYDAIVVYSNKDEIVHVYGYQLKEGRSFSKQVPHREFSRNFVIKGSPPVMSVGNRDGWRVPCGGVIDKFFGESGKFWTPQEWTRLTSTCNYSK